MSNAVNAFLAHQGIEVPEAEDQSTDEFLEHFGIPGMKWGRRKAAYQALGSTGRQRHATAAQNYLNSNGGSKAKAITKTVGKTLGIQVLGSIGAYAVGRAFHQNPSVIAGASVVSSIFGVATTVGAIRDIHGIAKSKGKPHN